ncbi:MAG: hypothetical protein AAFS10_03700, partial [Myxococcota bacterium]
KTPDGRARHMLFNTKWENPFHVGGHAISDDGLTWTSLTPVYSRGVSWDDGTEEEFRRRERPQLLWLDDCRGVLYTGVDRFDEGDWVKMIAVPVGDW